MTYYSWIFLLVLFKHELLISFDLSSKVKLGRLIVVVVLRKKLFVQSLLYQGSSRTNDKL